jgi:Flp pilus assembly protein TadG
MMFKLRALLRDEAGGAMVETAFALPVLITMIYGIFQFGIAMYANSSIQNALGDGARYATLCVNPSTATGCGRPTNDQIIARIKAARMGAPYGTYGEPTVVAGPDGCRCLDLGVTYVMPTSFILVNGPVITFVRSKRVYVAG